MGLSFTTNEHGYWYVKFENYVRIVDLADELGGHGLKSFLHFTFDEIKKWLALSHDIFASFQIQEVANPFFEKEKELLGYYYPAVQVLHKDDADLMRRAYPLYLEYGQIMNSPNYKSATWEAGWSFAVLEAEHNGVKMTPEDIEKDKRNSLWDKAYRTPFK